MPHFSPEMVWHTLSFSTYAHTYIHTCMHSTRPWRGHYKTIFFSAEIFLGVGGGTPHPRDGLLGTMRQKAFNKNDLER